jgi:SOS regulatory protein LexA
MVLHPRLARQRSRLAHFYRTHKRLPTYSEMLSLFAFRSKNAVAKVVNKLVSNRVLARDQQGVLIPNRLADTVKILGTIQAGFPSPAEEELIDTLSLDEFLIRKPEATYLLKVSGDSMIDAGIHPSDLVLVERGRAPRNRDIVVVQVDGNWTMKYLYKNGKNIQLQAANSKYAPIKPKTELVLGGVVIACIRKYVPG